MFPSTTILRPTLRALLEQADIVRLPGISDGLSARLAERAGFTGGYLSGGAFARGMGYPDLGVVTLSELEARVRNIAEVCTIPFVVDLDSGFGGALNIDRAVARIERAGAAGLHIDDFEVPRRRRVARDNLLPLGEMLARFRIALAARASANFVIIGRTDAALHAGLDEAIDRANALADTGADLVYVEHLEDRHAIDAVARRVAGPKLVAIMAGKGAQPDAIELQQMGFRIVTWPADAQLAATGAMAAAFAHLRDRGTPTGSPATIDFAERDEIVGAAAARAFEDRYLS